MTIMTDLIFRQVIERVNHAIIVADKEGNFILWNKAAKKILGLSEAITGKETWQSHFNIIKMDGVVYNNEELPIMRAIAGEVVSKEKLFISSGDGTQGAYLEVDAFPILDEKGSTILGVASFSDITANIRMERFVDELTKRVMHIQELIKNSFYV